MPAVTREAKQLGRVEDAGLPRVNGEGAVSQLPPPVLGREGAVVELLGVCLGAAEQWSGCGLCGGEAAAALTRRRAANRRGVRTGIWAREHQQGRVHAPRRSTRASPTSPLGASPRRRIARVVEAPRQGRQARRRRWPGQVAHGASGRCRREDDVRVDAPGRKLGASLVLCSDSVDDVRVKLRMQRGAIEGAAGRSSDRREQRGHAASKKGSYRKEQRARGTQEEEGMLKEGGEGTCKQGGEGMRHARRKAYRYASPAA